MINVTENIKINNSEIKLKFIHASGPGGQNVNKVATVVQLRFNIKDSKSLTDDIRYRLINLADRRITKNGTIIIYAKRFRSQEKNRLDAINRFILIIRKAAKTSKLRRKSQPTLYSKERRLSIKKRQSETKRSRRTISYSEDQ